MMEGIGKLVGAVSSHVGYVRLVNQDNFILQRQMNEESGPVLELSPDLTPMLGGWYCFGVFDGMGGGEQGEVASWLAAKAFQSLSANRRLRRGEIDLSVRNAFRIANREIITRGRGKIYGTTATVVFTDGDYFKIYHLGDSRCYLYRLGAIFRLTRDHTLASVKQELGVYRNGVISRREKHVLTEYIGADSTGKELRPEETPWFTLMPCDRLLLCTDGLHDLLEEREMREQLRNVREPLECAWKMTEIALTRGGGDNITTLVAARE